MTELTPTRPVTDVRIADIEIGPRLRPVSEATVSALAHVIAEHGFTVPILVRKVKTTLRLIDGAHRLTVLSRLAAWRGPMWAAAR